MSADLRNSVGLCSHKASLVRERRLDGPLSREGRDLLLRDL
jgi:hypothetical protein